MFVFCLYFCSIQNSKRTSQSIAKQIRSCHSNTYDAPSILYLPSTLTPRTPGTPVPLSPMPPSHLSIYPSVLRTPVPRNARPSVPHPPSHLPFFPPSPVPPPLIHCPLFPRTPFPRSGRLPRLARIQVHVPAADGYDAGRGEFPLRTVAGSFDAGEVPRQTSHLISFVHLDGALRRRRPVFPSVGGTQLCTYVIALPSIYVYTK